MASPVKNRAPARQGKAVQAGRTFIDISDLINYFCYHMSASGIQRVVLECARSYLAERAATSLFVVAAGDESGLAIADVSMLQDLFAGLDAGSFTRESLTALAVTVLTSPEREPCEAGDVFFVPGAFWASSSTLRSVAKAKRAGARVGFLCHDLIPIRQPEFCDQGLSDVFRRTLECLVTFADFAVGTSEQVVEDLKAYIAEAGLKMPAAGVKLADELFKVSAQTPLRADVAALTRRSYVLVVSTIEVRKNHTMLLAVWQKLIAKYGNRTPDLVWVGRRGWLVDDLMQRVERLDYLDGKLTILHDLSDSDLTALYRNCWFTALPSLSEGWGLPVSESLLFGKPALISDIPAFQEVGRGFTWHVDPFDITGCTAFVSKLIEKPALVDAAAKRIRERFKPRKWREVGHDMAVTVEALAQQVKRPRQPRELAMKPGEIYPAGSNELPGAAVPVPALVAGVEQLLDEGWFVPEVWGRWLRGARGSIRIALPPADAPEPALVFLRLNAFPGWTPRSLAVSCVETRQTAVVKLEAGAQTDALIQIDLPGGTSNLVLWADREDRASSDDPRSFSAGLIAFGVARLSDAANAAKVAQAAGGTACVPIVAARADVVGPPPPAPLLKREFRYRNVVVRIFKESPKVTLARVAKRLSMQLER